MRRKRSLITLAAALALLIGSYAYLRSRPPQTPDVDPGPTAIDISRFDRETIVSMSLRNEHGELAFERHDDQWIITKPYEVPILQNTVVDLARTFSALGAEIIVEESPTDLTPYGLNPPVAVGEAKLEDGSRVVLHLGNRTPEGSTFYLMKEGDPRLYTVWMHHGNRLSSQLSEYRNRSLPEINFTELEYFFMSRPNRSNVEILVNPTPDEDQVQFGLGIYQMTQPYSAPMGVDGRVMGEIMEAAPKMVIQDFINDHPEDLGAYGLEEPSRRLTIRDKETTLDLIFGDETEDGSALYFQIAGADNVYSMAKDLVNFMDTASFDLVEKFAFIVNIEHVDRVVVEGYGRRHNITLTRRTVAADEEGEEDEVITTYRVDGQEIEEKPFKRYYQALIGLLIDTENFHEPDAPASVRTTYYLNRGSRRQIVIEYKPFDRDFYSVVREGTAEFLIARHRLARMFEELDLLIQGE